MNSLILIALFGCIRLNKLDKYSILLHDLLQNHFDARGFIAGLVYGNFYGLLKFDLFNVLR